LLLGGVLVWVSRRDRLTALLMALPPTTIFWLIALEFTSPKPRALVTLLAWLLTALAAALIVRLGSLRAGVWLALGLNLAIGLSFAYARTYFNYLEPPYSEDPSLAGVLDRTAPGLLALSTLVIGPLLVRGLGQVGPRGVVKSEVGWRLALGGLLLQVVSYLGSFWWHTSIYQSWVHYSGPTTPAERWLGAGTYLGLLLYLAGLALLVLAGRRVRSQAGWLTLTLLALLGLTLPLAVAVPFYSNLIAIPPGLPFWLRVIQLITPGQLMAVGIIWLAAAGWIAARINHTRTTIGTA
jgi:hypothetical protein